MKIVVEGIPQAQERPRFNGLAFKDDNVITDIHAVKRYSDRPRLEIEIKEVKLVSEERS